ncbi:hypothetical protein [Embleya sp. NPDC005971]|uniref:hypothetical protein n=1 Tax=Embleya sp. NPDC005971 TaxID=3156724 RepID=UPI0033F79309
MGTRVFGDGTAAHRHARPPIPIVLEHLSRQGGYAVPWISLRHRDGTAILGVVDHDRVRTALVDRWCQTCGRPLRDRIVVLARHQDFAFGWVSEPGMHPECAFYSTSSCPMLTGVLPRHRSHAPAAMREPCGNPLCDCRAWGPPDDFPGRAEQPAERWFAIWLDPAGYRIDTDPVTGRPAVSLAGIRPLTIRPLPATGATADEARTLKAGFASLAFLAGL